MTSTLKTIMFQSAGKRHRNDGGPEFLGRNGFGIATGVEIWKVEAQRVRITPISTTGIARAQTDVAMDALPQVIAALASMLPDSDQGPIHGLPPAAEALLNDVADVMEAFVVHGDVCREGFMDWIRRCRAATGNLPEAVGKGEAPEAANDEPMSAAAYVAIGGSKCPVCGSPEIEGTGGVDMDGSTASNPVVCLSCNAGWDDVYTLSGYNELEVPKPQESEVAHAAA